MNTTHTPPPLSARDPHGNKGTFGRVLIVGGSPAMIGAPILSGRAALRSGSGLVQLAYDDLMHVASIAACPELIGLPGATDLDTLVDAATKADAVAVGPGWGHADDHRAILLALLALDDTPLVIDADALNLIARAPSFPTHQAKLILTPHPGEMKRLAAAFHLGAFDPADDAQRLAIATTLATLGRCVVLLKGARTVVVDGASPAADAYVNTTGDASLAKAGTGDVLTGVIASLVGQGMTPFDAACAGAHVHGLAGEIAGRRFGQRSALASDVIEALPEAFSTVDC